MNLYLIRHGQTEMNTLHCLQGRTDTVLNETGIDQAKQMHDYVTAEHIHFDTVLVSPLTRVKQTAEYITGQDRSSFIEEPRLIEMGFGINEGHRLAELPPDFYDSFFTDPRKYVAPEGAETYVEALTRVKSLMEDLRNGDLSQKYKDKNVLLASHGATTHCILQYLAHTPLQDMWKVTVDNCALIQLHLSTEACLDKNHTLTPGLPYSEYEDTYTFLHPGFTRPRFQPKDA